MLPLIVLADNYILVAISTNSHHMYEYLVSLKKQMNWHETFQMRQVF